MSYYDKNNGDEWKSDEEDSENIFEEDDDELEEDGSFEELIAQLNQANSYLCSVSVYAEVLALQVSKIKNMLCWFMCAMGIPLGYFVAWALYKALSGFSGAL